MSAARIEDHRNMAKTVLVAGPSGLDSFLESLGMNWVEKVRVCRGALVAVRGIERLTQPSALWVAMVVVADDTSSPATTMRALLLLSQSNDERRVGGERG